MTQPQTQLSKEEVILRRRMRRYANLKTVAKNKILFQEFDGVLHLKQRAQVTAFGYKKSPTHKGWWEPIPLELAALERARDYVKARCNYVEVADWLYKVTERKISSVGLYKALRRGY